MKTMCKELSMRLNLHSILLALFLGSLGPAVSPAPLAAQQATASANKILAVEVEGNNFADASTIIAISGLQVNDEIKPGTDMFQRAISNLWRRKQFSEIDIVVEKLTPLGVFLKIKVKEFPRLSEIIVEGNDEISAENVRKAVGKYRGDILSPYDIYMAKRDILKLYSSEGMPFATVEAASRPADTISYDKLVFTINEGNDYYVTNIEFTGNEQIDDGDLAGTFEETNTKSWYEFWRSSKFSKEDYEKDKTHIIELYHRNGYIDADIVRDTVIYDPANEAVTINIEVSEGKKYYVRDIDFTGNLAYDDALLKRRLNFAKGDVFDQERFQRNLNGNEEQSDVRAVYLDNGYLTTEIVDEITRIPGTDSVDINVKIFERNQFRIRLVDLTGNTKTMDKVIRRELYTRPGDYFNRSAVIRSIRGLGVLNYFNPESLNFKVLPVDDSNVDIAYTVEERSSDAVNASVGYAGSYGFTGSVGLTLNNFSISEPLQGGAGQIFSFNWEFGANRLQTITVGFTEPWLFGEPTTLGFNIFDSRQSLDYSIRQTGASVNIGRRFRWPDDYFRGDWIVKFKRNDVQGNNSIYRTGITTELSLTQVLSRVSLDNAIFPTDGSRFSLTTQLATGAFGVGTTDYFKNELSFELFNPLLQVGDFNRLVLYLSSNIGYVTGLKTDTTIPPIEYYTMGGNGLGGIAVTPLRGYPDRSIGPRDDLGRISGGTVMARHVLELRFALSLNPIPIYLTSFAEAGNVWSDFTKADPFDLKRSAGVGLRVLLNPIGLIGFDYGYGFDPIGERGDRSAWRFHFQFGR